MSNVSATGAGNVAAAATTTTATAPQATSGTAGVAGGNTAFPGIISTPPGMYFNPFDQILQLIQQLMQRLQQYQNFYPPYPPTPPVRGDRTTTPNVYQGQSVGGLDSDRKNGGRLNVSIDQVYEAHTTRAGADAAARRLSQQTGQPLAVVESRVPDVPILYAANATANTAGAAAQNTAPIRYRTVYNVVKLDPTVDLAAAGRLHSYAGTGTHIDDIVEGKQVRKVTGKDVRQDVPPPPVDPGPPIDPLPPIDPMPLPGPFPQPDPLPYPYYKYAVGGGVQNLPAATGGRTDPAGNA